MMARSLARSLRDRHGGPKGLAIRRLAAAPRAILRVALGGTRRAAWIGLLLTAGAACAQPSLFGPSGLLSIPTAEVQPYSSFSLGANWVDQNHRGGAWGGGTMAQFMTVGVAPNLELSLCATNINGRLGLQEWTTPDGGGYSIDRMASVQWRVAGAGRGPALAVGSQDFVGTGDLGPGTSNRLYRANYAVASARLGRVGVHAGIGTGRLRGAFGGVECPLGPRLTLLADHDARFTNAGLRIAVAPRIGVDVALMGLYALGGGITYSRAM